MLVAFLFVHLSSQWEMNIEGLAPVLPHQGWHEPSDNLSKLKPIRQSGFHSSFLDDGKSGLVQPAPQMIGKVSPTLWYRTLSRFQLVG